MKSKEILDLKFILSFLTIMVPYEFTTQMGSITSLKGSLVEDRIIFDEIIQQMKTFFINRNLDGKGLFRVLAKQAQEIIKSGHNLQL